MGKIFANSHDFFLTRGVCNGRVIIADRRALYHLHEIPPPSRRARHAPELSISTPAGRGTLKGPKPVAGGSAGTAGTDEAQ